MKNPETYDEWRTWLGLPDVPTDVKTRARLRHLTQQATAWQLNLTQKFISMAASFTGVDAALRRAFQAERDAARDRILRDADLTLRVGRWALEPEPPAEPDPRTPQQRALPKPATAPPMWANDPTKSRRRR